MEVYPKLSLLDAIKEKDRYNKSVFQYAVRRPESLKSILEVYPKSAVFEALKEEDINGCSALIEASGNCDSLEMLLVLLNDRDKLAALNLLFKKRINFQSVLKYTDNSFFRLLSVLPLKSAPQTNSFFKTHPLSISLESVLCLESTLEVYQTIFDYLMKNETKESCMLLNDYVRLYKGDVSKCYHEKLSFLAEKWKAEGLVVYQDKDLGFC